MDKFVVVGFPKCGQNSLINFLQKEYNLPVVDKSGTPPVTKSEFIWHIDAFEKMACWEERGYQCVIIMRNPVDRIWSSYHYFGYYTRMSYEQYLDYEGYHPTLGEENPIKQSNYSYWIKRLSFFKPLIYDLDEMMLKGDFPLVNKSEDPNYKLMPEAYKALTIKRLNETLI